MPDFMANNPFVQGFTLGLGAYNQAAGRSMERQRLSMEQQRMFDAAQYNALRTQQLQQEIDQSSFLNPLQRQLAADNAEISKLKTNALLTDSKIRVSKAAQTGQIFTEYFNAMNSLEKGDLYDLSKLGALLSANPDLVQADPGVHEIFMKSQTLPQAFQAVATQKIHQKYYEKQILNADLREKQRTEKPPLLDKRVIDGVTYVFTGFKYDKEQTDAQKAAVKQLEESKKNATSHAATRYREKLMMTTDPEKQSLLEKEYEDDIDKIESEYADKAQQVFGSSAPSGPSTNAPVATLPPPTPSLRLIRDANGKLVPAGP